MERRFRPMGKTSGLRTETREAFEPTKASGSFPEVVNLSGQRCIEAPSRTGEFPMRQGDSVTPYALRSASMRRRHFPQKNSLDCLAIWSILTDTNPGLAWGSPRPIWRHCWRDINPAIGAQSFQPM